MRAVGEMPEWPNGTDSKSVVPSPVPRVRIPISPPLHRKSPIAEKLRGFFVCAVKRLKKGVIGCSSKEMRSYSIQRKVTF
jgi:hypothetical protein